MRKLAFYPKFALANLWRNKTTYLPYLLACTVSIFTFYTLLAINLNGALDGMPQESIVKSFTAIGTVIVAIFCSVLLFYTNSFLVKRRKKELGLYSILGLEKRNMAGLLFFETLFIAIIALAAGLILGLLFSRVLFLLLLALVRFPVTMAMPASLPALGATAGFFGIIFLLTLLANLRAVRLADPISLLAGAKQGEKEPRSSLVLTVIGVLALGAGYFIALYFRSPIQTLLFFFLAAGLVILGTYFLFVSGSVAVLKLLRKNKRFYYQPNHFIAVSGMLYRMKQNAAGLASICVLSCMVLTTVSATVSLNVGAENALHTQHPQEYSLHLSAPQDGEALLAGARQIAAVNGLALSGIKDYRSAHTYAQEASGAFTSAGLFSRDDSISFVQFLLLEDYNRAEGQNETLQEGEALMLCTGGRWAQDTLSLDGITYRLRQVESIAGQTMGTAGIERMFLLVLPSEEALRQALAARPGNTQPNAGAEYLLQRQISFDLLGDAAAKEQFLAQYHEYINTLPTAGTVQFASREESRGEWYAMGGGFLFLGLYFGTLFLLAAAMVIFYKQLSEGYDDAERYKIMQQVGMSAGEVKKAIGAQIRLVFFLPLAAAAVHMAVAFWPVSRTMVLFGITNQLLLAGCTAATLLVYALVYLLVYRRTAGAYFRIVKR